jgi:hypothetical protein
MAMRLVDQLAESGAQTDASADVERFVAKVRTFTTCPLNAKHAARMAPFAQPPLLALVSEVLALRPLPRSADVSYASDLVCYFYCVALLAHDEQATEALRAMAIRMRTEAYEKADLMRRTLGFFPGRGDLQTVLTALEG